MKLQDSQPTPLQVEVSVQFARASAEGLQLVSGEGRGAIAPAKISPDRWQQWFHQWLTVLKPDLSPSQAYELSLCFTTDEGIRAMNAQYRALDRPTDVLAFAALEVDCPDSAEAEQFPLYLGDIVISTETAQRQAQEQGHSYQRELAWLAAHGLLHLLGWDHPDEASLEQMLDQQNYLLSQIGSIVLG
ncbi:MAG: rRNA maturation RNase YbeY [Elainellaceae cyanobacterium]